MDIQFKELFEKSIIENSKLKEEILTLNNENNKLIDENKQLKERLKKYTAPTRNKTYYENHKEEIKEKVKEYKTKNGYKKPPPEKVKEYSKKAYEKKKQKLLALKEGEN